MVMATVRLVIGDGFGWIYLFEQRIYETILIYSKSGVNLYKIVALVEWLTRCPAILPGNPFGGVGSNPAGDDRSLFFFFFRPIFRRK